MITLEDIQQARNRTAAYIGRTPLQRNATLSQRFGMNVYLKYELFQKTGSFKPRGAFNQALQLSEEQRSRGIVAVSGGNFAQGAAYAGQVLGIRTLICMPAYTPRNYIDATRAYGADIDLAPTFPEVFDRANAFQREGMTLLHPYDNPHQMAGNGVIGLEILEDMPGVTDMIISIGGGGLLAGNIVAFKTLKPEVRIWGVETEGADTMGQALQAGKVVQIQPTSLARTLGAPYVAEDALILAQKYLHRYVKVSDQEAYEELVFLLERAKVITELAASCTLAALEKHKNTFSSSDNVVLLLCGGNTSLENLLEFRGKFKG